MRIADSDTQNTIDDENGAVSPAETADDALPTDTFETGIRNIIQLSEAMPPEQLMKHLEQKGKQPEYRSGNWGKLLKPNVPIRLITYGSLLNDDSVTDTVSENTMSAGKIVAASGVRLIANFEMEETDYDRYAKSLVATHRTSANVQWTGNASDKVYGTLREITFQSEQEITDFCKRERGYHLQPVIYETPNGEKEEGLILLADNDSTEFAHLIGNPGVYPNEDYLRTCIEGALKQDATGEFLHNWLQSFYLSDGSPLVESNFFLTFIETYKPLQENARLLAELEKYRGKKAAA